MASTKQQICVTVDREKYMAAKEIYKGIGISFSAAVNMFICRTVQCNGLPLDITKQEE